VEKISGLLGKPVISIYDGNIDGYVKNVLLDKKLTKLCYIVYFDDNTQEEKIVQAKSIFSIGQDAITLRNCDDVLLENSVITDCINPINCELFTIYGAKQSKITDAIINKKHCVEHLLLQNGEKLFAKDILNTGKNVAILKTDDKKISIANFKNKVQFPNIKSPNLTKVEIQQEPEKTKVSSLPKKILTSNYEFLIGRKVDKNIYADNNELIIKKQSKITNMIIDIACKNGKLKELTANSVI
jgi:hypothetical protein